MKDTMPLSISFGFWGRLRRKPVPDYSNTSEVTWPSASASEVIVSIVLILPDGRVVDVPVRDGVPEWDLPSLRASRYGFIPEEG
jgi:hypothetical protein